MEGICRTVRSAGLGEGVSLKEGAAHSAGRRVFGVSFDLLRNKLNFISEAVHEFAALVGSQGAKIDLDVVDELDQREGVGIGNEVVEGEAVSGGFEFGAALYEVVVGDDGFQNLEDQVFGGKELN